jgi:hypothetical protein
LVYSGKNVVTLTQSFEEKLQQLSLEDDLFPMAIVIALMDVFKAEK